MPNRHSSQGVRQQPQPQARNAGSGPSLSASSNSGLADKQPAGMTVRKTRHFGRIVISIFTILLLFLGALTFGGWHWVDGKLNKSSWLTTTPGSSGTSWLILGSDQREKGDPSGGSADDTPGFRTDTILVLTKPKHGGSSLVSIPRDSLVKIEEQYMKINAVSQAYSQKALVTEVEDITGQKIDHVVEIKFGGLKEVVNALGGVRLCYDQNVDDSYSGLKWQAGCRQADGDTALAFSRMRYVDPNNDFGRAQRQRQVIAAITKKALSASTLTNVGKANKVADAALAAASVDEHTNPYTLFKFAMALRSSSSDKGITGSVYWTDPDYQVSGVGSTVLLDSPKNLELFEQLESGTHKSGTVGTLSSSN